jgi:hypothetical protein
VPTNSPTSAPIDTAFTRSNPTRNTS